MIQKNLVLVLGAGASKPFGFPTGQELYSVITRELQSPHNFRMYEHLQGAGFEGRAIHEFHNALSRAGTVSVDAFLEHRPEYRDVGKAAMACVLLCCERESELFSPVANNWYRYLFKKLNAKFEEFDKNSISILTFNYDRSLEQFLYTTLLNTYGKSTTECIEKLQTLPIIHLHGQLGKLPIHDPDGVRFDGTATPDKIRKCVQGITIIHEDVAEAAPFQHAHKVLANAERICFLGFGYDETNLQRLLPRQVARDQQIFGSASGLTPRECQLIEGQFQKLGLKPVHSMSKYCGWDEAIQFLREACPFDWD